MWCLNNDGSANIIVRTQATMVCTVNSFKKIEEPGKVASYMVIFEGSNKSFQFEADEVNPILAKAIGADEDMMVSDLFAFFNKS